MTPEEKKLYDENLALTIKLRENFEEFKKGTITKADYDAKDVKIAADILALGKRIDEMVLKMQRPPAGDAKDGKALKEGQAEYKASFFNFLRTGELRMDDKARAYDIERKALVEDATGQILVPEELETDITRALPQINIIRANAYVRTTGRDRIRRRSLTEVTTGWGKLELGGTPVETTIVPSDDYQYVEDAEGLAKIGKDELADSDINLEPIIADSFARAFADQEEAAFVNGTGHAHEQPDGMLLGSTIIRIATTAANAVTFDDILNLIYAVPAQYRQSGRFIMNSATELVLRKLRVTEAGPVYGEYLWQPSLQAGTPATLCGYPVLNCDQVPKLTDGVLQDVVIFGDIKAGYRIIDRMGMSIQRLLELYATAGMIGLLASRRVTGGVVRADALRILREHS